VTLNGQPESNFKMGNCCAKKHLTKKKAFHQELGVPLLESLAPELGKHAKVIVVRLVGLDHISSTSNYTRGANAFVRFRLIPHDEVGGEQEQSSTIVPGTSTPLWVRINVPLCNSRTAI